MSENKSQNLRGIIGIVISLLLAALIASAGSTVGLEYNGWPLFALCVAIAFVINWLVFIPSFMAQTEHYFDLTGSITYLTVTATAISLSGRFDLRSVIIATLVIIWALRLGSFLFKRIKQDGKDSRFDTIKPVFLHFLMVWTLQGLWVSLTLAAGLAVMTSTRTVPVDVTLIIGLTLWIGGFAIEVVADSQKRRHRAIEGNRHKFIRSGLWAWSRHPNYFGEIMLWIGIAVMALPVLQGWQFATLISPVFVYLLLSKVSGVPMLEAKADATWGDEPQYQHYKKHTPELMMRRPMSADRAAADH